MDEFLGGSQKIKASLGDSGQHEDHAELHGKSHHSGAEAFEAFWKPRLSGGINLDFIWLYHTCILYSYLWGITPRIYGNISRLYMMWLYMMWLAN